MECTIKIGGEAGQGVQSIEALLIAVLTKKNYHFFATKNYMSRIRGGHNYHMIRVSDMPVHALRGGEFEVLIALDAETEVRHGRALAKKGVYITKERTEEIASLAKTEFNESKASNYIITGIVTSILGISIEVMKGTFPDATVQRYVEKGYEYARMWKVEARCPVSPADTGPYVMTGNQALNFGAILGGCQFMAGYPMTPATGIMDHFTRSALKLPVHFEQAEDEISAINMALGASYAGLRSMVATSGGGFALMQEGVSLAGMTETPIVIIDSQRPAPATGLPTRTEQADLEFILHAGHGEFPRVIYAPGSVDEALLLARRSFTVADDHQVPVFILSDQYLADSVQRLELHGLPEVLSRKVDTFGPEYERYRLTKSGISPLTYPGLSEALVQVDSDEHDEKGRITEDLALRVKMVDKRLNKMAGLVKDVVMPTWAGKKNARTVLVSWGSNKQVVEEAVAVLEAAKVKIAALHFSQVYPLTESMIDTYALSEKQHLICIENNATGQFAKLLKRELGLTVTANILKYDGTCFTVAEIVARVKKVIGKKKKR